MIKKFSIYITGSLTLFLGFFLLLNTNALSVSAATVLSETGYLPNGTPFTFGVPFETDEFSEDGSVETVVVDEDVSLEAPKSKIENSIMPFRIDYGTKYISRAYWITRDGVKSISIYPKRTAPGWTPDRAWGDIKANFSFYYDWKNERVLKQQFDCHARPISPYKDKIPWNIEPSKTSISWITCN